MGIKLVLLWLFGRIWTSRTSHGAIAHWKIHGGIGVCYHPLTFNNPVTLRHQWYRGTLLT